MLIAVMFIGILTAGMFRVYSSNLAGFQRVNDMIGSQRRGRWALASLQDDVATIGFFALVPLNQPTGYSVTAGTQEPFMVLPAPTPVVVTGPDPNAPATLVTAALPVNPDELQFVSDFPVPIQATVGAPPTATALTLDIVSGSMADVQVGDVVAVLDANLEQVQVGSIGGNTIAVSAVAAAMQSSTQSGGYALSPTLGNHQVGTPVFIYRPNIVTRYSLQPQAWDPANPAITVPCLVRQQATYPPGGTLINWAGVPSNVIAENIDGFRVDMSFDGGATWLRNGAANWDALVTAIGGQLAAFGAAGVPVRDPNNPLWFRTYPFMIRLDVTSRSAAPRAEASDVQGVAAYVRRTQTLMVSPRNFGLPL
jgi:hypothetical protein